MHSACTPCTDEAKPKTAAWSNDELRAAFQLVAKHYQCSDEEIGLMKVLARADMENAACCYQAMQREIVEGPATGINERIRISLTEGREGA